MSIATVVTRGYGSFGTIPLVVTAGYSIAAAAAFNPPAKLFTPAARATFAPDARGTFTPEAP